MIERDKVKVIRSPRRTAAIEIQSDGTVLVRVPSHMKEDAITRFLQEKTPWIKKHLEKVQRDAESTSKEAAMPLTDGEMRELYTRARAVIPRRVAELAALIGVTYGRVTIRAQHTRWGSCSSLGNLSFNCLLMLCPTEVLYAVILHELCHRKEMGHSPRFYQEVKRYCPDYEKQRAWLKANGEALIRRLQKNG